MIITHEPAVSLQETSRAFHAAELWARRFLITGRELRAAVTETRIIPLHLVRSRWAIRRRRVEPRWTATESRARKLDEPLDPREIDPWGETPEDLAARTRQLVACPSCQGARRIQCPLCHGAARIPCDHCDGSGWTPSTRSRRLIRCQVCRKTGIRVCPCFDGMVSCEPCAGRGKVERWLEIREESFVRLRTEGDEHLDRLFPSDEGTAFTTVGPLEPVTAWSGASLDEAPPEIREVLLCPQILGFLDARSERLQRIDLQIFEASLTRIRYRLGGCSGSVDIQSWDGRALENAGSTEPLRRRLRWMRTSALTALALGLLIAVWFAARHPFYLGSSHLPWLGGLAPLLALLILPLVALLALPRGALRAGVLAAAGLPPALVLLAQIALATTGEPSLDDARELAREGRVQEAQLEAAACADLKIDGQAARDFHDRLQLEQVRKIRDSEQAWKAIGRPFYTAGGRSRAEKHALAVSIHEVAARQARSAFDEGKTLLIQLPEKYQEDERVRELWINDEQFRARSIWERIDSRENPLGERLRACEQIRPFLEALDLSKQTAKKASLSKSRVEAKCDSLDRERLREIARREREIERQREAEERERRRAERAAQAAARAWANAPLLCRDGTLSPSCVCGQSSRRGCCSWHGGVAGCSR